jgi:NADH-quinone oxidoreductase subunit M
VLVGAFKVNLWLALLGSLGMILGAAYMLYLYRRVVFGALTRDDLKAILDLSPREIASFAPLGLLTLWMGVYPGSFTQFFDASVHAMVEQHMAAVSGHQLAAAVAR